MFKKSILTTAFIVTFVSTVSAQEVNCADAINANAPECTGLTDPANAGPITNFAPVIAPVVGGLGAAGALFGGGGGTTSTVSTTSTTSTTN